MVLSAYQGHYGISIDPQASLPATFVNIKSLDSSLDTLFNQISILIFDIYMYMCIIGYAPFHSMLDNVPVEPSYFGIRDCFLCQ